VPTWIDRFQYHGLYDFGEVVIPLDKQVASLEWSKKLKALGVRQESAFYWLEIEDDESACGASDWELSANCLIPERAVDKVSAFTVAELLNRIPKIIEGHEPERRSKPSYNPSYLHIFTDHCIAWCVAHRGIDYDIYSDNSDDENLANVLAKMLIHLIEKGIVKVEGVNARAEQK